MMMMMIMIIIIIIIIITISDLLVINSMWVEVTDNLENTASVI
jgi:hypothetical protein